MKKLLLKGVACLALVASVAWFAACSNTSSGGGNSGYPYEDPNENPDDDDDEEDGEGTTFNGIFKSPIQGLDLCIWERSTAFGLEEKDGKCVITPPTSGWTGGHIGSMDPVSKGTYGIDPYDFSKVASYKFKIQYDGTLSDKRGNDGEIFWLTPFNGDNGVGEKFLLKPDELDAGVVKDVTLKVTKTADTVHTLFALGFGALPTGDDDMFTVTIFDFAFYDEGGNEVVPKLVK